MPKFLNDIVSLGQVTVGVDDTGHDVKFFGATAGSFMLWDESADALILTDSTPLNIGDSSDLQIKHNGSDSLFNNNTGDIYITNKANNKDIILQSDDNSGGVATYLALDGSTKTIEVSVPINVGVDNTGYDVKFFGATSGQYMLWDESADTLFVTGEIDAGSLDISGDVDIDGTLEADAITVNGTTLANYIPTVNANKITVTDNNNDEAFPVVFHDEGGNTLLDDTGIFKYNPNSGTLYTTKLIVSSTSELTSAMTLNAGTPIVFEGATGDAHETSLSIVDPTGDRTQYIINQSGYIPLLSAVTTTAISATPEELNVLDGVTAGTVTASLGVVVDSNKAIDDITVIKRKFPPSGSSTNGTITGGDIVYFGGTTSMTAGAIYHYKSDGTWELADADAAATSDGLLAVALGAASDTNGMCLRGMVTIDHDPGAIGDVLFLSTTAGDCSATAPSGDGDIVRVIGYQVNHASNGEIWFCPDGTYVEVSA